MLRSTKFRLLICCLLAATMLLSAQAEAPLPVPPAQAAEGLAEGESVIPPAYPVPDYVEWLLDTARGELGYTEEKNGTTKYGAWTGTPTAEWCAEFLCWCVHQVDAKQSTKLLNQAYPYYTGTNVGRNWFLTQGRYISRKGTVPNWGSQWMKGVETPLEKNSYVPQPGDWVFFSNSATGDTTHVAMVEYCARDESGKIRIHVIEGNNPDAVARNIYPLDYWAILGYGTVYDLADITLRFGNDGEKVIALQKELVAAGLLEAQYVTGKYGAITTQAIKDFQKERGLAETGIANQPTQLALHAHVVELSKRNPENWKVQE